MIKNLNDKNFKKETENGLVLVDFWAPWCNPCLIQAPILEKVGNQFSETEVSIMKLNIDENPQIANDMGIMSIPTLILMKNGDIIDRMSGVQPEKKLNQLINKNI